jgi:uncharacterized membrane protein
MSYKLLLLLHLVGMIFFLGIGTGSAFYKFMADRSKNLQTIVEVNKIVVLVDWLFTTPAAFIQPISGIALAYLLNISLLEPWLFASIILYIISGSLWLVAVYLQIKMKNMALSALEKGEKLPSKYQRYVKQWILLGIPSFLAMFAIMLLMMFHYWIN